MTTVVNEKNQVVNEEGLPFYDPIEALPPGDPKAVPRSLGFVLPFKRSEADRKRSKEERARWMDSVFNQLEEAEAEELAREEAELDAQQVGELERLKAEYGIDGEDEEDDNVGSSSNANRSTASSSKAGVSSAGSAAKFSGMRRGFLNSKPKAAPTTTPSGPSKGKGVQCAVSEPLQVRERTIQPASSASPAPAPSSPTSKPPIIKSAQSSGPIQELASTSTAPPVGSRLRFEDLSIADDDERNDDEGEMDNEEEEEAEDDDDDDEDGGFNIEDWSSDEGYDSDDLQDLAPDLDADIDNAELAREYARARAGLLQSRALDEARRGQKAPERHGGEDIVPLNSSISDPSAHSSGSTRVSRFRASRLARAVNDFDTLLQGSKTGERNPLLVVPDLAPIRFPKQGDLVDASKPGVLVDNVDLDGESDEEEERLHEVMKARLAALEDQKEVAGVSKTVVERTSGSAPSIGRKAISVLVPGVERTGPAQEPASLPPKASPEDVTPKPVRKPTTIEPKYKPLSDDNIPTKPQPQPLQPTHVKEVRFAAETKADPEETQAEPSEPAAPKVSRFKARKMAERGLS
ncbi:hypothetical protein CF319_g186 [Tilletia indica]|nr:hypothetical protein CF319_g186 [Tilletia indica]